MTSKRIRVAVQSDGTRQSSQSRTIDKLPAVLQAQIVSFSDVREHVRVLALLCKSFSAACRMGLSWSSADFMPFRKMPGPTWVETWNCFPRDLRVPVLSISKQGIHTRGQQFFLAAASRARAISAEVSNAGNGVCVTESVWRPKQFPLLASLTLHDVHRKQFDRKTAALPALTKLDLRQTPSVTGFRVDRARLPLLADVSLHDPAQLDDSVLPLLTRLRALSSKQAEKASRSPALRELEVPVRSNVKFKRLLASLAAGSAPLRSLTIISSVWDGRDAPVPAFFAPVCLADLASLTVKANYNSLQTLPDLLALSSKLQLVRLENCAISEAQCQPLMVLCARGVTVIFSGCVVRLAENDPERPTDLFEERMASKFPAFLLFARKMRLRVVAGNVVWGYSATGRVCVPR